MNRPWVLALPRRRAGLSSPPRRHQLSNTETQGRAGPPAHFDGTRGDVGSLAKMRGRQRAPQWELKDTFLLDYSPDVVGTRRRTGSISAGGARPPTAELWGRKSRRQELLEPRRRAVSRSSRAGRLPAAVSAASIGRCMPMWPPLADSTAVTRS